MANVQVYLVQRASGKNAGETVARFATYEAAKSYLKSLPHEGAYFLIDCLFTA